MTALQLAGFAGLVDPTSVLATSYKSIEIGFILLAGGLYETLYSKILSRKQQGNSSAMLHCQQQHCALRAVCTCHKDLLGIANETDFILNVFTLKPVST